MNYTKTIVVFLCLMVFLRAESQTLNGLQNSNFGGVHSVYSNPALLTSMAYKRHANVSTFGAEVNTNLVSLTAPFTLWQAMNANVPAAYLNDKGKWRGKMNFYKVILWVLMDGLLWDWSGEVRHTQKGLVSAPFGQAIAAAVAISP